LGAALIATLLAVVTTAVHGQSAASPAGGVWADRLQVFVNLTRIIEVAAFVFSGYQFWAGRRERKVADLEAAEQARIDSIYQAWQVINSAQGKGGSGGRVEALADLLRNQISLAGINLDGAWLEGVQLPHATMVRSSLVQTNLTKANLVGANLEGADFRNAILVTANLMEVNLRGANIAGARLSGATLDGADLSEIVGWTEVGSLSYASIEGIRYAPAGLLEFARENGAVDKHTAARHNPDEDSYSHQFRAM
jgi:hypothetical protein